MDPSFSHKNYCTRDRNRHLAREVTNFSRLLRCSCRSKVVTRLVVGRGCPTSPYQPNGRRESRRLRSRWVSKLNNSAVRQTKVSASTGPTIHVTPQPMRPGARAPLKHRHRTTKAQNSRALRCDFRWLAGVSQKNDRQLGPRLLMFDPLSQA
jgi:hypothetical protein